MLNGVLLPVTTPFQAASYDLDGPALTANLRRWGEHPIQGVVVGGSTGEAPLLEDGELPRLVAWSREALRSEVLVLAGTGMESTRATVQACLSAAQAGADAVLVRPPSYFREQMTPDALREHFLEVAERSPVPVVLYHVPKFVPVELVPDLVGRLVEHENIVGIKDSSGDLKNLGALADVCAGRASVLVGSGAHLYAGLELGAVGGVLAVALIAPGESCTVVEAWDAGRTSEAGRAQEILGPLHRTVVGETGVPGIKHALDLLGYSGGPARPPLRPPTSGERRRIRAALERASLAVAPEAADATGDRRVR